MVIVCHLDECPRHLKPMRLLRETASAWIFECPTCANVRAVHKTIAGGTLGAGEKEDGCKQVVGRGF
jgi:hypothetical protein